MVLCLISFIQACRRTGDPSKFMFCKRCDGAYHCYCLQPPHKVESVTFLVSLILILYMSFHSLLCIMQSVCNGPYLCTKHARCHSCGSNVPGNGLSVRYEF